MNAAEFGVCSSAGIVFDHKIKQIIHLSLKKGSGTSIGYYLKFGLESNGFLTENLLE